MPAVETETEYVTLSADPTLATIAAQLAAIEARMSRFEQRMSGFEARLLSPADIQRGFDDLFGIYGQVVQLREVYHNLRRDQRAIADAIQLNDLLSHGAPALPPRRKVRPLGRISMPQANRMRRGT